MQCILFFWWLSSCAFVGAFRSNTCLQQWSQVIVWSSENSHGKRILQCVFIDSIKGAFNNKNDIRIMRIKHKELCDQAWVQVLRFDSSHFFIHQQTFIEKKPPTSEPVEKNQQMPLAFQQRTQKKWKVNKNWQEPEPRPLIVLPIMHDLNFIFHIAWHIRSPALFIIKN